MPLYTRLGDSGKTTLFSGEKVSKSGPRIHAYGTVDELDALIGVIRSAPDCPPDVSEVLLRLQNKLYRVKSDLATPMSYRGAMRRITQGDVDEIEGEIDVLESEAPKLNHFIVPGGTKTGSMLHHARTVCRRAERWTVRLAEKNDVNYAALRYLNRLGDFLFALGRAVNANCGVSEIKAG